MFTTICRLWPITIMCCDSSFFESENICRRPPLTQCVLGQSVVPGTCVRHGNLMTVPPTSVVDGSYHHRVPVWHITMEVNKCHGNVLLFTKIYISGSCKRVHQACGPHLQTGTFFISINFLRKMSAGTLIIGRDSLASKVQRNTKLASVDVLHILLDQLGHDRCCAALLPSQHPCTTSQSLS